MSAPRFVPAFDRDGDELWMSPDGWMHHVCADGSKPDPADGWRRLHVVDHKLRGADDELVAAATRVMAELRLARVETPSFLVLAIRELRMADGKRHRLSTYAQAIRNAIGEACAEAEREAPDALSVEAQALRDRARPFPTQPAVVVGPGPLPGADTGEWVDMEALIAELAHGLRAADLDVLDADEVHPLPAGPMPLAELPRPAVPLALPGGQGKALIAREIDDPSLANTVAIRPTDLGWALDTTRSPS